MRFFSKIKDIWSHEELRKKIAITLGLILIFRLGSFIPLPGVNYDVITGILDSKTGSGGGGFGDILSLFTGGAFNRASIFALGIMPYISASIIIQLMSIALPSIQKMQKEGESGRKKITQYTRFLTIAICLVQSPGYIKGYVVNQQFQGVPAVANQSPFWWFAAVLIMVCCTLVIMWIGEKITDKGVGNGISLLIMIGIIASFPQSIIQEWELSDPFFFIIEMAFLIIVIGVCVALVQAIRKVPVQMAKLQQASTGMPAGTGARNFIPLKVNASGVMPIIFAQVIMTVPLYLSQSDTFKENEFINSLGNIEGFGYNLILFIMVVAFTFFYTAITINPNQMADDLKRQNSFIPGVKPGRSTSKFLDGIISRITLPGAIFLGLVTILPAVVMKLNLTHDMSFAMFFGGTSLLIMVGVILDTLQQIESYLLSRHYDGLMKSGKMRNRSQSPVSGLGG